MADETKPNLDNIFRLQRPGESDEDYRRTYGDTVAELEKSTGRSFEEIFSLSEDQLDARRKKIDEINSRYEREKAEIPGVISDAVWAIPGGAADVAKWAKAKADPMIDEVSKLSLSEMAVEAAKVVPNAVIQGTKELGLFGAEVALLPVRLAVMADQQFRKTMGDLPPDAPINLVPWVKDVIPKQTLLESTFEPKTLMGNMTSVLLQVVAPSAFATQLKIVKTFGAGKVAKILRSVMGNTPATKAARKLLFNTFQTGKQIGVGTLVSDIVFSPTDGENLASLIHNTDWHTNKLLNQLDGKELSRADEVLEYLLSRFATKPTDGYWARKLKNIPESLAVTAFVSSLIKSYRGLKWLKDGMAGPGRDAMETLMKEGDFAKIADDALQARQAMIEATSAGQPFSLKSFQLDKLSHFDRVQTRSRLIEKGLMTSDETLDDYIRRSIKLEPEVAPAGVSEGAPVKAAAWWNEAPEPQRLPIDDAKELPPGALDEIARKAPDKPLIIDDFDDPFAPGPMTPGRPLMEEPTVAPPAAPAAAAAEIAEEAPTTAAPLEFDFGPSVGKVPMGVPLRIQGITGDKGRSFLAFASEETLRISKDGRNVKFLLVDETLQQGKAIWKEIRLDPGSAPARGRQPTILTGVMQEPSPQLLDTAGKATAITSEMLEEVRQITRKTPVSPSEWYSVVTSSGETLEVQKVLKETISKKKKTHEITYLLSDGTERTVSVSDVNKQFQVVRPPADESLAGHIRASGWNARNRAGGIPPWLLSASTDYLLGGLTQHVAGIDWYKDGKITPIDLFIGTLVLGTYGPRGARAGRDWAKGMISEMGLRIARLPEDSLTRKAFGPLLSDKAKAIADAERLYDTLTQPKVMHPRTKASIDSFLRHRSDLFTETGMTTKPFFDTSDFKEFFTDLAQQVDDFHRSNPGFIPPADPMPADPSDVLVTLLRSRHGLPRKAALQNAQRILEGVPENLHKHYASALTNYSNSLFQRFQQISSDIRDGAQVTKDTFEEFRRIVRSYDVLSGQLTGDQGIIDGNKRLLAGMHAEEFLGKSRFDTDPVGITDALQKMVFEPISSPATLANLAAMTRSDSGLAALRTFRFLNVLCSPIRPAINVAMTIPKYVADVTSESLLPNLAEMATGQTGHSFKARAGFANGFLGFLEHLQVAHRSGMAAMKHGRSLLEKSSNTREFLEYGSGLFSSAFGTKPNDSLFTVGLRSMADSLESQFRSIGLMAYGDEFLGTVAYRTRLDELAEVAVEEAGVPPSKPLDALQLKLKTYQNPVAIEDALDKARSVNMRMEPAEDSFAGGLLKAGRHSYVGQALLFLKTPINEMTAGLQYTPGAQFLSSDLWAGLLSADPKLQREAGSKIFLAHAGALAGYVLNELGILPYVGSFSKTRGTQRTLTGEEGSFVSPSGTSYNWSRIFGFALAPFHSGAAAAHLIRERNQWLENEGKRRNPATAFEHGKAFSTHMMSFILSQAQAGLRSTFTESIDDLMNIIHDKSAASMISALEGATVRTLSSGVPMSALFRELDRARDSEITVKQDFAAKLLAQTGATLFLKPENRRSVDKTDWFGNTIRKRAEDPNVAERLIGPLVETREVKPHPIYLDAIRLQASPDQWDRDRYINPKTNAPFSNPKLAKLYQQIIGAYIEERYDNQNAHWNDDETYFYEDRVKAFRNFLSDAKTYAAQQLNSELEEETPLTTLGGYALALYEKFNPKKRR